MKKMAYKILGYLAKRLSGHNLRKRFPGLNKAYLVIRSRLAPKIIYANGYMLHLDNTDSLGLTLNGIYEAAETNIMKNLVKEGHIVLDIGANIGYFTLLLSGLVGENGKVIAFEPEESSYGLLRKNIAANNCQNVDCFQLAVSDVNEEAKIYLDDFGNLDHQIYFSTGHSHSQSIKSIALDSFLVGYKNIDFIKMDIQGAETKAIKGMKNLLLRNKGVKILTEFWPTGLKLAGSSQLEFLNLLESLGFLFYDTSDLAVLEKAVTSKILAEKYPLEYRSHTNILCVRPE